MANLLALRREVERLEARNGSRSRLAIPEDKAEFVRMCGFEPNPWQEEVLRSNSKRKILNAARQAGKTLVVGADTLHLALTTPKSFCLVFAPSLDQSLEFFRRVTELCVGLGMENLDADSLRKTGLDLRNGSRIEARPGSERTARSRTASYIAIDEAARAEDPLYFSLRPMLARTGGALSLLSTPNGKRGFYYDTWQNGSGWEKHEVTANDLPEDWYEPTTREFLEEERGALPHNIYKQEYFCTFLEAEGAVFYETDLQAMTSPEVTPLFPRRSA